MNSERPHQTSVRVPRPGATDDSVDINPGVADTLRDIIANAKVPMASRAA